MNSIAGHDVLVVEDDPELNELVGVYAKMAGFGYRAALTGADALTLVKEHHPDVVVLDLMLPDMSGFDVCRQIKRSELAQSGPAIIMLTAMDSEASRQRGLQCGAAEYMTKPFDPDLLMATIARHSKKHNDHG